ncbi:MAG TPA: cupredoxin domain-containing protein [Dehalococcoidia bacterium]|nr:cupredoxin domain-containing protein [Dehalococcoidia bacterium]
MDERERPLLDRLILPVLIPLGVLVVLAIVLYSLSRIFLGVSHDVAPAIAITISTFILLGAAYVATQPVSREQIAGMLAVPVVAIVIGGVFGELAYDGAEEEGGEAGGPTTVAMSMGDNFFDPDTAEVTAGVPITFNLTNDGQAIHNMRIAGPDGEYDTDDDAVSDPDTVRAGETATLEYSFPEPGEYAFRCDFHPTEMTGTVTAEEGEAGEGAQQVSMVDNAFEPEEVLVPVGTEVTIEAVNNGQAVHNIRVAGPDGDFETDDDVVTVPEAVRGGETGVLTFTLPEGMDEMLFICDFHPTEMTGVIRPR